MLKLVAAGGMFAGSALAGLAVGAWLSAHSGNSLWVLGGLFVGIALGGYGAARLVLGAMK